MSSFGTSTTLHRINETGRESTPGLVFRASNNRRLVGIVLASAFGAAAASVGRVEINETIAFALFGLMFLAVTARARRAEICVDEAGLTATGDLGGAKPGTLYVPWGQVRELHYGPGGGGEVGGLYVRQGNWCSRCVLPGLTEDQADDVIAAIAAKYPAAKGNTDWAGLAMVPRIEAAAAPIGLSTWRPRWSVVTQPPH